MRQLGAGSSAPAEFDHQDRQARSTLSTRPFIKGAMSRSWMEYGGLAGRDEAQRGAGETGPTAGRPRLNPPRQHMADRAPRRGSLPMSGARLTAALECANDAGVRFTLRRPGDSHGASRVSAGAAASYASADRPASAVRAAPSEAGATPQAEGLVRAWS